MNDLIYIRILQHDMDDSIRIGAAHPVTDLDISEKNIVEHYEKDTAWCGGFAAACEKYYRRIAIVNARTLEIIRIIYKKEDK